jgi:PAS domain S-box-containing protein
MLSIYSHHNPNVYKPGALPKNTKMPAQPESAQIEKAQQIIAEHPEGLSVSQVAELLGSNRNSTARYLGLLAAQGYVDERTIGPTKLYVRAAHQPYAVQMELFKQALDAASCGITIADAQAPDLPLIYVNEEFEKLTGYTQSECLGKNCRFLQGPRTEKAAVAKIRKALENHQPIVIELTNYRKDGTAFRNQLRLAPIIRDGKLTHFVGVQTVK